MYLQLKKCVEKIIFLNQNMREEKINLMMMCGRKENLPDKKKYLEEKITFLKTNYWRGKD